MMNKEKHEYEYDVALSFAGEDRIVADEIAELLVNRDVGVFYDLYEQAQLWGKDLYQHLQSVYRDKAKYCIVFVSKAYAKKLWTKHELRQAQERALTENEEYILPLRLDDTSLPGINETASYISVIDYPPETIADFVLAKLYGDSYDKFYSDPPADWKGETILKDGYPVATFWAHKMTSAQKYPYYKVTSKFRRIPYGKETGFDMEEDSRCGDCAVKVGEYHVPSCDIEECPCCHGQALSCDCDLFHSAEL